MLIKSGDSGSSCKFNTFFFIETTDSYLKKKKKVWAFQVVLVVKNLPANAGDIRDESLILGSGRSPGGGHGNPLQYSCLENSMDRRAWWATVHGAAKRQT